MTASCICQAILRSPDLASFLGLQRVDALHMPVPLSFVFVGLSGDGNMHANISAVDLQDWFSHLDHVLPHARVELSELDCQSDGERHWFPCHPQMSRGHLRDTWPGL